MNNPCSRRFETTQLHSLPLPFPLQYPVNVAERHQRLTPQNQPPDLQRCGSTPDELRCKDVRICHQMARLTGHPYPDSP